MDEKEINSVSGADDKERLQKEPEDSNETGKQPPPKRSWWARGLVLLGAAIFVLNMMYTWNLVKESNKLIQEPLATDKSATVRALKHVSEANANMIITINHIVDAQLLYKVALNKHNMVIVAMATAFGLIAVGFSLFVMGIEGAFEFKGDAGQVGRVILKATSPGLLCFLLAAAIMIYALTRGGSPISLQGVTVFPDTEVSTPAVASEPVNKIKKEQVYLEDQKKKFDLFEGR